MYRAYCCESSEEVQKSIQPRWLTDRDGNLIGYRVNLKTVSYFILSHPISTFNRLDPYWVGYNEAKYCAKLGMIPAYLVNLNRFTLLKMWGETAKGIFSPTAEPFPREGYVHWKLIPSKIGQSAELSNMNFVLKRNSEIRLYEGNACDSLEDYFTFGFWAFPQRGFSDSSIIINDERNVHMVLKASKSIYIPEETYSSKMDLGREKDVEVQMATLWGLTKTFSNYELHKINNVVLTKNVAPSFEEEETQGQFCINGIVSEFRKRERRFPTLTTVALYEISNIELLMSIIGMVVSERFYVGESLANVGSFEEIKKESEQILGVLLGKATLDKTLGDGISDQFYTSLEYLNPLIITDGNNVFFMHPSVFVALLEGGLYYRLKKDKESLICVLKLLDIMAKTKNLSEVRKSKESKFLRERGIFCEIAASILAPAIRQIIFSRISRSEDAIPVIEKMVSKEKSEKYRRTKGITNQSKQTSSVNIVSKEDRKLFRDLTERMKKLKKSLSDN